MTKAANLAAQASNINASGVAGVPAGGTGLAAPGASGNVLTSNGTTWQSSALPAGGVTSLNGQTGAITNTDLYAIGSYITGRPANNSTYNSNTTLAGSSLYSTSSNTTYDSSGGTFTGPVDYVNTGTWRCLSLAAGTGTVGRPGLWVRIS